MDAPLSAFQAVMYAKTRQTWSIARGLLQLAVRVRLEGPIAPGIFHQAAVRLSAIPDSLLKAAGQRGRTDTAAERRNGISSSNRRAG